MPKLDLGMADGGGGSERGAPSAPPAPHVFLRGHTDMVTRLRLSHAGHILASAQGDSLGAAGEMEGGSGGAGGGLNLPLIWVF